MYDNAIGLGVLQGSVKWVKWVHCFGAVQLTFSFEPQKESLSGPVLPLLYVQHPAIDRDKTHSRCPISQSSNPPPPMAAKALVAKGGGPHPLTGHLGRVLFIYNEIYTKQTIYSLYRTMNNHDAIKQLAFVGKQTVPRALRKDRWTPLACVHFPDTQFGLNAFRVLREFRKMHETQYDIELLKLKKTERAKKLQDQKANSIADLAETIKLELDKFPDRAGKQVVIRWQDLLDGEFAKEWPAEVMHQKGSHPERFAFSKEDLPEDMQELLRKPEPIPEVPAKPLVRWYEL